MSMEKIMKKSRFAESQIVSILKQGESGFPVADLCREHGISNITYYIYGRLFLCKVFFDLYRRDIGCSYLSGVTGLILRPNWVSA